MTCKAGFPAEPCPIAFLKEGERVTRARCGFCKHYQPPPHILAWCVLWDRDKVVCQKPQSACATCPEKYTGPIERPSVIDWKSPEAVRAYYRERYARDPSQANARMLRFLDKHPDYFQTYRNRNKAKISEINRRYYLKRKGRNESSKG